MLLYTLDVRTTDHTIKPQDVRTNQQQRTESPQLNKRDQDTPTHTKRLTINQRQYYHDNLEVLINIMVNIT